MHIENPQEQRKALIASIEHWEDNYDRVCRGLEPYIYAKDCPLCELIDVNDKGCRPCVISIMDKPCARMGTPWHNIQIQTGENLSYFHFTNPVKVKIKYLRNILEQLNTYIKESLSEITKVQEETTYRIVIDNKGYTATRIYNHDFDYTNTTVFDENGQEMDEKETAIISNLLDEAEQECTDIRCN